MQTKEMLNKLIPTLSTKDIGDYALSLMDDLKLKHLPVVGESGMYSFLLSEKDIFQMTSTASPIIESGVFAPCIQENTSIIDILHVMAKDKLSLLPVIDSEGRYLGAVTTEQLVEKLDEITHAGISGSIIALSLNAMDYSLSQIANLAESNHVQIRTLFTFPVQQTNQLTILLKTDAEDASSFLRSLERFNYQVLYYSQNGGLVDEIMKKRLDELMYYLEM